MMKNKEYLTDFLSAGKYGVILSIAVSLLLLTGGFLFQGFSLPEAFQVWRSGMCILSGISLFLVAGSILTKKSSKIDKHSRWREKFKKSSLPPVQMLSQESYLKRIWGRMKIHSAP